MPTEAPVVIVPYDPEWPNTFTAERTLLSEAIAPWLVGPIEHIGSTAIPGMPAKPVIDIMAAIESLDAARPALAVLEQHQYCYAPYRTEVMHWFCKPSPAHRTHHLHLVPFESRLWIEQLAFRDYLRGHAETAAEYAALKQRLAETYRFDRETYTSAKTPFITRVIENATSG
jgi:GrpB-like predicted nucleotidyltransferase (UPF0157 family)